MDGRSRALCVTAAAILALAAFVAAQEREPAGRPQLPDLPSPILTVADPHKSTGGLEYSDLASVAFQLDEKDWVIQGRMSRPLVEGMFTVFEMDWDCDGQRSSTEVETRAAVGSRFHPSSYASATGSAPMSLVRASWASPFDEHRPNPLSAPRVGMTNWDALASPSVGGSHAATGPYFRPA